jgi:toxin ParE1/3/4
MEYEVVFSEEAQAQLQELEVYLAGRFYPGNAERYIERLVDECESLAGAPQRGTRREELGAGIRSTGFERRVTIYFRVLVGRVVILGIFYGGRSPGQDF